MPQTDWLPINGIVTRGYQVASGKAPDTPYPDSTIKMQQPFFLKRGLDLTHCFAGTLNIDIAPTIWELSAPSYTFEDVNWTPLIPPETFSFSPCQLTFAKTAFSAWVYYPHEETKPQAQDGTISHIQSRSTIEIIAPRIPHISYGDLVSLYLNNKEITLS